jgi:deoxyadenosine/deoxycytidine kinase
MHSGLNQVSYVTLTVLKDNPALDDFACSTSHWQFHLTAYLPMQRQKKVKLIFFFNFFSNIRDKYFFLVKTEILYKRLQPP